MFTPKISMRCEAELLRYSGMHEGAGTRCKIGLLAGALCGGIAVCAGICLSVNISIRNKPPNRDCVVLLHGLGRSALSMKRVEWFLEKQGYSVINRSYPSKRFRIEALASGWLPRVLAEEQVARADHVHFVTHSLGGIILRQYLETNAPANLGRVVMLAPPNHGTELVDRLGWLRAFQIYTGVAAQQLGTSPGSFPNRLAAPAFELGIIAGDRSHNPLFSKWLPGPDDGKVSVQSTKLEGMKEHLVVHHTHTWMMWRKEVLNAILRFVQTGSFGDEERAGTRGRAMRPSVI